MSKQDQELLVNTVTTASQLPPDKQQRLLGYAEGLAAAMTERKPEPEKED